MPVVLLSGLMVAAGCTLAVLGLPTASVAVTAVALAVGLASGLLMRLADWRKWFAVSWYEMQQASRAEVLFIGLAGVGALRGLQPPTAVALRCTVAVMLVAVLIATWPSMPPKVSTFFKAGAAGVFWVFAGLVLTAHVLALKPPDSVLLGLLAGVLVYGTLATPNAWRHRD
jgi:hypothetical protein